MRAFGQCVVGTVPVFFRFLRTLLPSPLLPSLAPTALVPFFSVPADVASGSGVPLTLDTRVARSADEALPEDVEFKESGKVVGA